MGRHSNGWKMLYINVSVVQRRIQVTFYVQKGMPVYSFHHGMHTMCHQQPLDKLPTYLVAGSGLFDPLLILQMNLNVISSDISIQVLSLVGCLKNLSISYHVIRSTPKMFLYFHVSDHWSRKFGTGLKMKLRFMISWITRATKIFNFIYIYMYHLFHYKTSHNILSISSETIKVKHTIKIQINVFVEYLNLYDSTPKYIIFQGRPKFSTATQNGNLVITLKREEPQACHIDSLLVERRAFQCRKEKRVSASPSC